MRSFSIDTKSSAKPILLDKADLMTRDGLPVAYDDLERMVTSSAKALEMLVTELLAFYWNVKIISDLPWKQPAVGNKRGKKGKKEEERNEKKKNQRNRKRERESERKRKERNEKKEGV